jgi:hypothetical protein
VEVFRFREFLPDEAGADDRSVADQYASRALAREWRAGDGKQQSGKDVSNG